MYHSLKCGCILRRRGKNLIWRPGPRQGLFLLCFYPAIVRDAIAVKRIKDFGKTVARGSLLKLRDQVDPRYKAAILDSDRYVSGSWQVTNPGQANPVLKQYPYNA